MDFVQWAESRYLRPVVIVDATPAADAICLCNGLDLVQLLRPFASLPGSVLTAHVGERGEPTNVRNFAVRFMRPDCVREVDTDGYRHHVQRFMRGAAAMDLAYGEQLDGAVKELLDTKAGGPLPSPVRISSPAVTTTLLERSRPVWHTQFVRDYHALVRCGFFESVDHPVGIIHAASTAEPGGIDGILRSFKEQSRRAKQLRTEAREMDPDVHQYYLLVHDMSAGSSCSGTSATVSDFHSSSHASAAPTAAPPVPTLQEARKTLAAMQQLHGSNYCALIKINSVADPQQVKSLDPEPWVEANQLCLDVPAGSSVVPAPPLSASPAQGDPASSAITARTPSFNRVHGIMGKWPDGTPRVTGCYLSPDDVAAVKDVVGYYLSQSLFRYLERRLRVLDAKVQDRRTTTLGKVANWFKSKEEVKPRAEVYYPANGGPARYLASSLEMMMRHCADMSMYLQDYNGAVQYFKMCLEELIGSAVQRPYNRSYIAGCQEGIGLAYFFLGKLTLPSITPWYTGGTRAGIKLNHACRLEVALNDYVASGTPTYALRIALFLHEFCQTRSPPVMDRAQAVLQHILKTGLTNGSKLFGATVSDMLASCALFGNPPHPAGQTMLPTAGLMPVGTMGARSQTSVIPANYPVSFNLRMYVRHLVEAGARYYEVNSPEAALRCYLRVLGVLRRLGDRGCWGDMYEHVLLTVSRQYFAIGQNIKGLVMASAAVAQGTPMYRSQHCGLENFQRFWERQAAVLARMGYSLSPHMFMPCIVRSSFHVAYNYYSTDDATEAEARQLGKDTTDKEWRHIEDYLKNHYNKNVLSSHPTFSFPAYHGELKRDLVFPTSGSNNSSGDGSGKPRGAASGINRSGSSGSPKHYYVAHTEPLWLSFVMHNPIGGAVTASNISILYMSRLKPDQLWKSAATTTVTLEAGEHQEVDLAFSPVEPGDYVVIGLCWSLLGQEGYYYFATRESRPGCSESLYEYAIENPTPKLDAEENIIVTVTAPHAWVTATLDPPLPARLRDTEYFHTNLVLTNGSAKQAARHVTLQRSPRNAHLMYLQQSGITTNLRSESAIALTEHLGPGESASFKLTVRAQHDHGDTSVKCMNSLFFLIGYLSGDGCSPEGNSGDGNHTSNNGGSSTAQSYMHAHTARTSPRGREFSGNSVRLHRLLRRLEVVPLMAVYSTVLPPSNAELASAVVITVKHITAETTPVRVARVMALHRSTWSVTCAHAGTLLDDRAGDCLVPAGSSLTLPLLVQRRPSEGGTKPAASPVCRESNSGACGAAASATRMDDAEAFEDLDSDAEEADARNAVRRGGATTAAASVYVDAECLSLRAALPSPTKAAQLVANVGDSLADSDRNRYFMRTSFCGAGRVGGGVDQPSDQLAFYLDRASQAAQTRHEARMAERARERRAYGALLERYTPIAVGVAWAVDNGPDTPLSSGQLFHFVDPVEFLQRPANEHLEAATGKRLEELAGATAAADHQAQLCQCLIKNRSTVATERGAVVYHAHVPRQVATTETLPGAALAPVTFRCLSLSPVPLLVEVGAALPGAPTCITNTEAGQESRPGSSVMFVGKAQHNFFLAPGGIHEVSFTAHLLAPGLVDCNCFQVAATPLLFQSGLQLSTGMSKGELLRRVRGAIAITTNTGGGGGSGPKGKLQSTLTSPLYGGGRSSRVSPHTYTAGCGSSFATATAGGAGGARDRDDMDDTSSVASALSRTARATCQLQGSTVNHTGFEARQSDMEDILAQLVPRGFHRRHVRVLGAAVAALTEARFLHLGTRPVDYVYAASEAFMEKNRVYAADVARYERQAEAFREKEAARARGGKSHSRTTYVYRPRVRPLSSADHATHGSKAVAATEEQGSAPASAPAQPSAVSPSRPPAPPSTVEDLLGESIVPAAAEAPYTEVLAFHASVSQQQPHPTTMESSSLLSSSVKNRESRPAELLPVNGAPSAEWGPETHTGPLPAAGNRATDGGDDVTASVGPPVCSPIVARHRDAYPLGDRRDTTDGFHMPDEQEPSNVGAGGGDSMGPSGMGSSFNLPAVARSFSQQGIDVIGDWAESAVASPVLHQRDSSPIAFPAMKDDEGANAASGNNGSIFRTALSADSNHASYRRPTRTGEPVPIENELLSPSQLQRESIPYRTASAHAGASSATSSSSSSSSSLSGAPSLSAAAHVKLQSVSAVASPSGRGPASHAMGSPLYEAGSPTSTESDFSTMQAVGIVGQNSPTHPN